MINLLKLPLKIIAIVFIPALFLLSLILIFFGWLSERVFAIISLLFGIGGVIMLFEGKTYAGIGVIVIALLISPFGIPAFAVWLADVLDDFKYSLKCFIAG